MLSRRALIAAAASIPLIGATKKAPIAPSWEGLVGGYQIPDWFRDAKFGMWAHWSAQCVPEQGDWYARKMYMEADPVYKKHLEAYGHPTKHGFMEIENLWKAEHWEPEYLVSLYKKAGARYFMSLGCHHDNLDAFDSAHHPWNTMRVGPRRDIVGTWEKIVRRAGLKFGISNHSSHAWHWYQPAYGYDTRGPLAGQRYDAARLTRADGKGLWWDGLDPQDLYTGQWSQIPSGITTPEAMGAWNDKTGWIETAPPGARGAAYVQRWLARQKDLVRKYRPDIIYFDDYELPFGQAGIEAVSDYYNQAIAWHGAPDVVLTAKNLSAFQRRGVVEDIERGFSADIRPVPWQTCTCIGNWHYDRSLYEKKAYVPAQKVIQRLCDVVSKNGNLLLSIPVRGDGTIDTEEEKIVADITAWFAVNGDAIYGTRPWRVFGEGPNKPPVGMSSEEKAMPFIAQDVRITASKSGLNLFLLDRPSGESRIACLGRKAAGGIVERVTVNGGPALPFQQDDIALRFTLPPTLGGSVPGLRIEGKGLV